MFVALYNRGVMFVAVTNQQVEVNSVYLQPELFHHFNYILNLTRDCEPRVRDICKSMEANKQLYGNAFIRIRYVGKMNDNIPVQKTMKDGKIVFRFLNSVNQRMISILFVKKS